MRYVTVTPDELDHLREGLKVLEALNEYEEQVVEIYFYGLTDNSVALDGVKEAISYWADEEIDEADIKVTEAVLIFRVSADTLYYLTGSGFPLRDGEAVYTSGDAEGPRTVDLKTNRGQRGGVKVSVGSFKTMALSRDDMSGQDFMMQYGTKQAPAPQEVQRTEPSQHPMEQQRPNGPGEDAAHRLHGGEPTPKAVHPGVPPEAPKKSSLNFDIESWLR